MKRENHKKITFMLALIMGLAMTFGGCSANTTVTVSQEPVEEVAEAADNTESEETVDEQTDEELVEEETADEEQVDAATDAKLDLEDGVYLADFNTDSSMFHINEAFEGKGILTVEDGIGTIHIVMPSKKIVNLYLGMAEEAQEEGASLIDATVEEVMYSDGTSDEAHAFDVVVPCLDEEFDLALVGTKGVWYDHKVSVTNVEPFEEGSEEGAAAEEDSTVGDSGSEDADTVNVTLEGGSGKATVDSPTAVKKSDDGQLIATITWSSPNYDYMIVGGEKYLPVNTDGNSVFEIPIEGLNSKLDVIADTVAMSKPHEIEYTLTFEAVK